MIKKNKNILKFILSMYKAITKKCVVINRNQDIYNTKQTSSQLQLTSINNT